jgi:hypothetical protein
MRQSDKRLVFEEQYIVRFLLTKDKWESCTEITEDVWIRISKGNQEKRSHNSAKRFIRNKYGMQNVRIQSTTYV